MRAVRPAQQRKVILSTNVAETSVTIDGVVAVIDSGLARLAAHSPFSGLATLAVGKISQASAIQRAGRAGRTRPGRTLRLYTRHDFDSRRPFDLPEMSRLDLAEPVLALAALGDQPAGRLSLVRCPTGGGAGRRQRVAAPAGCGRRRRPGDRDRSGDVAPAPAPAPGAPGGRGRAPGRGARSRGAGGPDRRARHRGARAHQFRAGAPGGGRARKHRSARAPGSPAPGAIEGGRDRLRGLGLDARAVEAVDRSRRQIAGIVARAPEPRRAPADAKAVDEALAVATLTAFPDRVMRRRSPGAREAVLTGGGVASVGLAPPGRSAGGGGCRRAGRRGRQGARRGGPPGGGDPARGVAGRGRRGAGRAQRAAVLPATAADRGARPSWPTARSCSRSRDGRPPRRTRSAGCWPWRPRAAGWGAFIDGAALDDLKARAALLRQAFGEEAAVDLDGAALDAALSAGCAGRSELLRVARRRAGGPAGRHRGRRVLAAPASRDAHARCGCPAGAKSRSTTPPTDRRGSNRACRTSSA